MLRERARQLQAPRAEQLEAMKPETTLPPEGERANEGLRSLMYCTLHTTIVTDGSSECTCRIAHATIEQHERVCEFALCALLKAPNTHECLKGPNTRELDVYERAVDGRSGEARRRIRGLLNLDEVIH